VVQTGVCDVSGESKSLPASVPQAGEARRSSLSSDPSDRLTHVVVRVGKEDGPRVVNVVVEL
jgi:hypothetical protein